jgi:transcriptional regulator with XRE-family HTH domain
MELPELDPTLLERVRSTVAASIRRHRKAAGVSQAAVADVLGISQASWSRIEGGKTDLPLSQLLRIVNALEIESIESLMGYFPSRALGQRSTPPAE